jgi:hypothetical protein
LQAKRIFSLSLLLLSFAVMAYFGTKFGLKAWDYLSMTKEAPAKILQWEIEEKGAHFQIKAIYEYKCQEKILLGKKNLPGPLFLNELAAVNALKDKSKESFTAHYDPKNPTSSSLERVFPVNYSVRFALSFLVLIYFFFFQNNLIFKLN